MSQHIVLSEDGSRKWVFGWDQPLMSYFLQVHHLDAPEDEQIVAWLGADRQTMMYNLDDLVIAARKHGLVLTGTQKAQLYGERDDGR